MKPNPHNGDTVATRQALVDGDGTPPQQARLGSLRGEGSVSEVAMAGDKIASVERRGDIVVMMVGAPASKWPALRTEVWKRWRVER